MKAPVRYTALLAFALAVSTRLWAGGSGLNVVVVVNRNSSNSVELGNYYCEQRGIPPQNLLRINWTGGMVGWTRSEFEVALRAPLTTMLAARRLTNQIDYVLLSMDIPYRVTETTGSSDTSGVNSTTAALFYGFKSDGCTSCPAGLPSCNLAPASSNSYAGSEAIYRQTPPISAASNNWMVVMLTSSNLPLAKALVDRGVVSDGSFPTQTVYLAKSVDPIRNIRYLAADDAIYDARVRGNYSILVTNLSSSAGLSGLLGFENGVQIHSVTPDAFVPGALADNLTSYSGDLFENSDHTDALDYLIAGATASYGTVVEPCAYLEKFASPRNYFYQARGFSAAECYYQSLTNPYQGILVGEPLAAPFALPANGGWIAPPVDALLTGITNLSIQFTSSGSNRPIQQVDLFLDGIFFQTITNVTPKQGNQLYVTLPGKTNLTYTVPVNAGLSTIASGIASLLNNPANSSVTMVSAYVHGDRIELRSTNQDRLGSQTPLVVSNHVGSASELSSFVQAASGSFLDTVAYGNRSYLVSGTLVVDDTLTLAVTKTNGALVTVSVTNSSSGTLPGFVQSLLSAVNAEPALQGSDGLVGEDLVGGALAGGIPAAQFNFRARSQGVKASQMQVTLTGTFSILPVGPNLLDENLADLQPRNHIYVTAGRTNLSLVFPINTTTNADGYHELTAVAYEGSHVRTQKRASLPVRIQNNTWSATFTSLFGGTNIALEATVQFVVAVNTNDVSKIELFTTGGLFAVSNNVSSTTFSVAATNLGIGLHPFYALVTRNDGQQYRTETKRLRIVGSEPPFNVSVIHPLPTLAWPATAGRSYQVLSSTDVTNTFLQRAVVTPTNSTGSWSETNSSSLQRFYRVKTP